jgi:Fanconi anemia group M protein
MFYNIFSKEKVKENQEQKGEIIIDIREKQSMIPSLLMEKNINIKFENLGIGDYLINKKICIERKSFSDFQSSIINKRLLKQLEEIKKYPINFLILELENKKEILHKNAIKGMILSCIQDFKVPIIFSENQEDTASYLALLSKEKSKSQLSLRFSPSQMSKEERKQFILEGFENIGPVSAKKLLENHKTLRKIFSLSKENLEKEIGKKSESFEILD